MDYLTKNYHTLGFDQIIKLSYNRVRPIFTTTFTTVAALIPLMLSTEQSFWKSLSISVTGGLIFSSVFVIVFIPVLYYLINNKKNIAAPNKVFVD